MTGQEHCVASKLCALNIAGSYRSTMSDQIFLLGSGGHAKMVIEAIRSRSNLEIIACLAAKASTDEHVLGIPVLTEEDSLLKDYANRGILGFVAIGENQLRRKLSTKLSNLGIEIPVVIAATAYVSPSARIGNGTVVMPNAAIGAETTIGAGSIINTTSSVDHDGIIGEFVHIAPGCHLAGNVRVGDSSFLGIGTVVIPERTVGSRSVVGAGAVVTRDVPDNETWIGCPARPMRR